VIALNRPEGQARKEAGQQLALSFDAEWRDEIMVEFRAWLEAQRAAGHSTVTIEAFRAQTRNHPPRPQAWGSMTTLACRKGLIAPAPDGFGGQRMVKAAAPRTHSHPIGLWEIA